jgi:hypothetical protein
MTPPTSSAVNPRERPERRCIQLTTTLSKAIIEVRAPATRRPKRPALRPKEAWAMAANTRAQQPSWSSSGRYPGHPERNARTSRT